MNANNSNARAALLSGLRTGGVRSTAPMPQTAAPNIASFNIPRLPEDPQYATHYAHPTTRQMPMTAAVDGPGFLRQQSTPFSPAPAFPQQAQAQQAMHMQMIQLEMMRMQALQAQQYQAQLYAAQQRRPNLNPPATAGVNGSFHMPTNVGMPMTAAIDGRFPVAPNFVGHFPAENTTVISGGTALGSPAQPPASKSESATNWRRGGNNNSVLRKKLSTEAATPAATKARPQGLSINSVAAQPMPVVAIDSSESENDDAYSTGSSDSGASNSPPTTPRSSSSIDLNKDTTKVGLTKSLVSRQPHGPPSGADELGPRNFANRGKRGPIIVVA
uniref:Uncharacterized protein n=1 Tax=Mycena chlorophos TaxID=658473 RepID=A0ABQ0L9R5_MYCCL|nr:predicted protein [Mycena chlorophos]